ncbi:MAG: hypothetical protein RBT49_10670 [Bacteroidales bacterium]|jgi:hypothetical protein|nr:hypothetical protein [Bacteroidales bacterium]
MDTYTRIIKLLDQASNVTIDKEMSNDTITSIVYDSPLWPERKCIYQVPGKWEIKRIQMNVVSLKRIIPEPEEIELMPVKINVPLK